MELLKQLSQQGYRLTKPRKQILKALDSRLYTVQEIADALGQDLIKVDLASIYRSLELFIKMDLVTEVDFGDGKKRYELNSHHHHHVVCKQCGTIEEVAVKEEQLFSYLTAKTRFQIQQHSLEFFGLCPSCQV